jgi:hypothetical protein
MMRKPTLTDCADPEPVTDEKKPRFLPRLFKEAASHGNGVRVAGGR